MKILLITPKISGIGGVAQHVQELYCRLKNRGFMVDYISSENTPYVNVRNLKNVSFVISSSLKGLIYTKPKYDIIHAHGTVTAVSTRFFRGKRILTIHGVYSKSVEKLHGPLVSRLSNIYEKASVRIVNYVTVVSKTAYKHYRLYTDKVTYIPNAINLDIIPLKGDKIYEKQAIYVGRISREKGVDILVKAFTKLKDIDLLIVGDGPLLPYLRKQFGHYKNIHFLGKVEREKALRLIKGADVFILPSRYEGLSTALLEAMACGTPVIASRVGGNTELIEDGVTGLLVSPGDEKELIKDIIFLVNNRKIAQSLADKAKEKVVRYYNWEKVFRKYLKLYYSLIGG